jgi:hypothetical protein
VLSSKDGEVFVITVLNSVVVPHESIGQTTRYLLRKLYLSVRSPCRQAGSFDATFGLQHELFGSFCLVGCLYGGLSSACICATMTATFAGSTASAGVVIVALERMRE